MKDAEPWVLRIVAIVVSVCILIWLGSLVAIYWGDEYASPAWSEQSLPPPRTY